MVYVAIYLLYYEYYIAMESHSHVQPYRVKLMKDDDVSLCCRWPWGNEVKECDMVIACLPACANNGGSRMTKQKTYEKWQQKNYK